MVPASHPKISLPAVTAKEVFHDHLGVGIEGAMKVGPVFLSEAFSTPLRERRVVLIDTPSRKVCHVDAFHLAYVRQGQHTNHVGAQGVDTVGLTPIHVGSAS